MSKRSRSKVLLTLCLMLTLLLPLLFSQTTPAATSKLTDRTTDFVSGEEYVIATASAITDDQKVKINNCAVLGVPVAKKGATVPDSLGYAAMPESNPDDKFLWKITDEGNGKYSLYSVSQKKYMKLENEQILLTTEKSTVLAVFSGGVVTFKNEKGEFLRFTNVDDSRFQCNSLNAREFKLYSDFEVKLPDEYVETEDPLMSIATFSDMHHEYGIQYWNPPYRKSTKTAVDYIKNTLGKVDVLLIGGDITGRRNNSSGKDLTWTGGADTINNFMKKNYELFQTATKTGSVMVVTGNHDPEPSVHMKGGYPSANSNDWSSYMKQGAGNFEVSVTYSDLNLSTAGIPTQYQKEVLGYRYTVNGIPFIGINTPFGDRRNVGQTGHNGLYVAQVEWLEDQLTAIGKDKTVVVLCHYPVTSIPTIANGGATKQAVLSNGDAQKKMNSVLAQFPNVIYTYGHIHGDNSRIAQYTTNELVFPSGTSVQQADNSYKTTGWISAFMGSLGFYGNSHQNALSDAELKVVQFLTMDFYEDHITFRYYNTGSLFAPNGAKELVSYTVQRDLSGQLEGSSDNGGSTNTGGGSSSTNTGSTGSSSTVTASKTDATSDSDIQDSGTPSDTVIGSVTDTVTDNTVGTVTDTTATSSDTAGTGAPTAGNDGNNGEEASDSSVLTIALIVGAAVVLAAVVALLLLKGKKKA